jgi:hypothetical protein
LAGNVVVIHSPEGNQNGWPGSIDLRGSPLFSCGNERFAQKRKPSSSQYVAVRGDQRLVVLGATAKILVKQQVTVMIPIGQVVNDK